MKTIKIKFYAKHSEAIAILLQSLELKIIMTWSEEGFMDDTCIYCICKLNTDSHNITPELQIEKLRERNTIKIL
jgi:hypothetical protein